MQSSNADRHSSQPLLWAGPGPESASATLILVHGRGASADGMLRLYHSLDLSDVAAVAPQAAGNSWYPRSFLEPVEENEPYLSSALKRLQSIVQNLASRHIPTERIAILGFSQGACLSCEFAARHPQSYGAVIALTGGLIGPPGSPRNYAGSLDNTPVFLGTSDPDPHVPFQRVQETQEVLTRMGAKVELRRYPGMPHTINDDELTVCRDLLLELAQNARREDLNADHQ